MFTGLVTDLGKIEGVERSPKGAVLRVATGFSELVLGESIAVDGVCLTVTQAQQGVMRVDASLETLGRTTLDQARVGQQVHLERALRVGDRLGGHLVSGHVDGIGAMVERAELGDSLRIVFEVPERLAPFVAPKGCICLDGTSLTVNAVNGTRFDIALVPFSQTATTFANRPLGSPVNIEVDMLAKYVARLMGKPGIDGTSVSDAAWLDLLTRQGYL
ncbi:MAG: riboflavin synthase [Sandaracinaceae bacterium]|nr:riboflavin synthase [Sandaracinaceae bacterium]